jgi:hypothetical protein
MNRYDLEKKVITKALKDPSFKKKLINTPREAIKEFLKDDQSVDLKFLDKMHIHVLQEKEAEMTLVLPHIKETNKTLSDKEIENLFAAEGKFIHSWCLGC